MKKSLFVVTLMSLMLIFFSGPAGASQATATAALNLSNIFNMTDVSVTSWSVDTTTGGGNFASATTAIPVQSETNYSVACATGYCAQATVPYTPALPPYSAKGTSQVTYIAPSVGPPVVLEQLALGATAKSGENGADLPTAIGSAAVHLEYEYTGNGGQVTFSIPYVLSLNLLSAGVPLTPSSAYGFSSVVFNMTMNGNNIESQELYKSTIKKNGQFLNVPDTVGTYNFNVTFRNGDAGTLDFITYATTSASQPVPIPGAIWLLGTGLIGLVGIRRRQNK